MSRLIKIISSCSLGFIFILMDTISYGKCLIPEHDNLSMFIFLHTTLFSQIFYNIFTSIDGVMASAIVENIKFIKLIYIGCDKSVENTLVCIFISTLFFALLSISLSGYCNYLKLIPKSALVGCLGAIGFMQFEVGYSEIENHKYFILILAITIVVSLNGFILQEKFPKIIYIIPLYSFIILVFFYLSLLFYKIDDLRNYNLILNKNNTQLDYSLIYDNLYLKNIKLKYIYNNIFNISTMTVLSLIHLPINLPAFILETNTSANFNTEMKIQGFANLLSIFSPVYFVCSSSLFFRKSGGTKLGGIFLGFLLLIIFFYGVLIRCYMPIFLLAMFPFLIGFSIIWSTFKEIINGTLFDLMVVLSVLVVGCFYNMLAGMLYGVFLNVLWFIRCYVKSKRRVIVDYEDVKVRVYKKLSMGNYVLKTTRINGEIMKSKIIGDNILNNEIIVEGNSEDNIIEESSEDNNVKNVTNENNALKTESENDNLMKSQSNEENALKNENIEDNAGATESIKGNALKTKSFKDDAMKSESIADEEDLSTDIKMSENNDLELNIIDIDYILFFCTIPRFQKQLKHLGKLVIFLISEDMDWLGRDLFVENVNKLGENKKVFVIGKSRSLDVKKFSDKIEYYENVEDI